MTEPTPDVTSTAADELNEQDNVTAAVENTTDVQGADATDEANNAPGANAGDEQAQ